MKQAWSKESVDKTDRERRKKAVAEFNSISHLGTYKQDYYCSNGIECYRKIAYGIQ